MYKEIWVLGEAAEPAFGFGENPYSEFSRTCPDSEVFDSATSPFFRRRAMTSLGILSYNIPAPAVTESLTSNPTNVSPALTESSAQMDREDRNTNEQDDRAGWSGDMHKHAADQYQKSPNLLPVGVRETESATLECLADDSTNDDSLMSTPELAHLPSPLFSIPSPKTPTMRHTVASTRHVLHHSPFLAMIPFVTPGPDCTMQPRQRWIL